MLFQGPPVILSPADQLDEVAATKGQLEGGQLIEDAAQGPDISFVVVGNTTEDLIIMIIGVLNSLRTIVISNTFDVSLLHYFITNNWKHPS